MATSDNRIRGFTLVEMLVVLGIIIVLVGVLFPTLRTLAISSERLKAPKDVCSSFAFPGQRVTVLS